MRRALIDTDGLIVNLIEWDPVLSADYTPPAGLEMLDEHPDAVIGGTYDPSTGTYTPPPPPPEPEPTETEQRLALLDELIAAGVVDQAITDGVIDVELAGRAGIDTRTDPGDTKATSP